MKNGLRCGAGCEGGDVGLAMDNWQWVMRD